MKKTSALAIAAIFALSACSDGPKSEEEDVVEGDEFPIIDRSEPGPGQGTDGADPADGPADGARVGRFRGGEALITGPEARCREGDFILWNAHLTACISDGDPTDQMQFTAGRLIDLVPTDDPTGDTLDFFGPGLGLLEASSDELAILRDGTDGGPAVLRSAGVDLPLKLLVGSLGSALLTPRINVAVETEYRLGPDDKAIEIVTWVRLEGARAANLTLGDLAFPGDLNHLFIWPQGFGSPGANEGLDAVAFVSPARSYGIFSDSLATPPLDPSVLSDSIFALVAVDGTLGSVHEAAARRFVTVGDGTTTSLRANLEGRIPDSERHSIDATAEVNVGFTGGLWAVFRQDGSAIDVVRVDASTAALELPAGDLRAELLDPPWGQEVSVEFTVPAESPVEFPAPDAIPVTVSCFAGGATEPEPACRVDYSGTLTGSVFQREGAPLLLPRGFTGTLRMSFGEAFDYDEEVIDDLQAARAVTADLERTLQHDGWVAGDLHQHAMRSADSTVPSEHRVLSNLAAGLDFLAPSDHDVIEDYPRVLERMGLTGAIHVFQGVEISPVRGHINAFPIPHQEVHAGGAPALAVREDLRSARQLDSNELLAIARDRGAQVVQINHARTETSSLFDWVELDPVTGEPQRRVEDMPTDFEAIELFNRASALCTLMRDWFGFHRRGHRVVGFGNSDTHSLGAPSGWPRNYVHIGEAELGDQTLVDAILAGRVIVSGGLVVDYGTEVLPGDVIEAAPGEVDVPVRVRSPAWAKADEIIVYVNGIEHERIDLRGVTEPEDLLDYEAEVSLSITEDSFVVFFAYSDETMSVVTPGRRPFGVTNPVFVDVGGDGWSAPGVASAADVPLPTGIPFCPSEGAERRLPMSTFEAMQVDPWSTLDHRH